MLATATGAHVGSHRRNVLQNRIRQQGWLATNSIGNIGASHARDSHRLHM